MTRSQSEILGKVISMWADKRPKGITVKITETEDLVSATRRAGGVKVTYEIPSRGSPRYQVEHLKCPEAGTGWIEWEDF